MRNWEYEHILLFILYYMVILIFTGSSAISDNSTIMYILIGPVEPNGTVPLKGDETIVTFVCTTLRHPSQIIRWISEVLIGYNRLIELAPDLNITMKTWENENSSIIVFANITNTTSISNQSFITSTLSVSILKTIYKVLAMRQNMTLLSCQNKPFPISFQSKYIY